MRLTVLVDNNTYIDQYYLGEPAVAYLLEVDGERFLFDTGYSTAFLANAKTMGLALYEVRHVVLSHGHNDHTGGLRPFLEKAGPGVTLTAHPHAIEQKRMGEQAIGLSLSRRELEEELQCCLRLSRVPVRLSRHVTFLGEIPQTQPFEPRPELGQRLGASGWEPDRVLDDSALAVTTERGLVLITGCAHSGICNILAYAKEVTGQSCVSAVLGGFHLFHADERARKTAAFLAENRVDRLYPCHCTSFPVRAMLHNSLAVEEVGVGLILERSVETG